MEISLHAKTKLPLSCCFYTLRKENAPIQLAQRRCCGGVINNKIKKVLLLSLRVKKNKIAKYLAKLQETT